MKNQSIIIMLLVAVWSEVAMAQVPRIQDYVPGTQAASLGEYGDIPVSLYSGRVAVSIPLAEVSDGVHTIPVTLEYSGGGIKVDQMPSLTGLGWVLNAGGCITRQVRGSFTDEYARINVKYGDNAKDSNVYVEYKFHPSKAGTALDGQVIIVNPSNKTFYTEAHETGHTLGLIHDERGVMTKTDEGRTSSVSNLEIMSMLGGALTGIPLQDDRGNVAGKGTVCFVNASQSDEELKKELERKFPQ